MIHGNQTCFRLTHSALIDLMFAILLQNFRKFLITNVQFKMNITVILFYFSHYRGFKKV